MASLIDLLINLIPFTILLIALWFLLRPTFVRRWISRIRTASLYQAGATMVAEPDVPRFALPVVPVIMLTGFIAGIVFAPSVLSLATVEERGDLGVAQSANRLFVMIVCVLAALVIHLRPNHSRTLKYTLVVGGMLASRLFEVGGSVRVLYLAFQPTLEYALIAGLSTLALWSVPVYLGICLSARRVAASAERFVRTGTPRSVIYAFAFCRSPAFGPLLFLPALTIPEVGALFLAARFVLIEAFRRHPIVFLRSFHYDGASTVFGRAIAPALGSVGVIRALVHGAQTGHVLLAKTSVWQFGVLETVADDIWQEWVRERLRSASLAIVDSTVTTRSVEWEIEVALAALGERRVIIIATNSAREAEGPAGAIIYAREGAGLSVLRARLKERASAALKFNPRTSLQLNIALWVCFFLGYYVKVLAVALIADALGP